jgi:hypothetical protein
MPHEEQFSRIIEKVKKLQKDNAIDLSLEEDLSIAVMNLVSIEEHCYFSGEKTEKSEYFDMLNEVRAMRKELLARMIDVHEGETWCITKHLLAATMRMIEVGTKYLADGKQDDAKRVFDIGSRTYGLFWALRLKLVDTKGIKKINDDQLNVHDATQGEKPWNYEDIMKKLVDCCNE